MGNDTLVQSGVRSPDRQDAPHIIIKLLTPNALELDFPHINGSEGLSAHLTGTTAPPREESDFQGAATYELNVTFADNTQWLQKPPIKITLQKLDSDSRKWEITGGTSFDELHPDELNKLQRILREAVTTLSQLSPGETSQAIQHWQTILQACVTYLNPQKKS